MVSASFLSYGSSDTRSSGSSSLTMNSSTQSSFCWYSGSVSKSHTTRDATTLTVDDHHYACGAQSRRHRALARPRPRFLRRPSLGLDHARRQSPGSPSAEVLRGHRPPPPLGRRWRGGGHRRLGHRRGGAVGSAGALEAVDPRKVDDAPGVLLRVRVEHGDWAQTRSTARANEA